DPQASALAQLTGADEATIRTCVALLLAGLIELGSALGFTLVSVATQHNPPPPSAPKHAQGPDNAVRPRANAQHPIAMHAVQRRVQIGLEAGGGLHVAAPGNCAGTRRPRPVRTLNPPPTPHPPPPSTTRPPRDQQSP